MIFRDFDGFFRILLDFWGICEDSLGFFRIFGGFGKILWNSSGFLFLGLFLKSLQDFW